MAPKPLVAGNWKMNGRRAELAELQAICEGVSKGAAGSAEVVVCPPATLIGEAVKAAAKTVGIGGQDCHAGKDGAHTGDISAEMLADLGASYVIVGHSERRADHGETSEAVRAKAEAALRGGLKPIVCIGETREERDAGRTLDVVENQLAGSLPDGATGGNLVIAYEPVWAIGTGLTPTVTDVAEVHAFIREALTARFGAEGAKIRVLYGGSVKPANAGELLKVANVDGALVGGASLKASDFLGIAKVYA
ncbi:triosephosphate isomerase [Terrihabitans soli]|uniref:Triosephosphate isomerase n=1 Tax=Terrihabitans soli TaxID=708113 RepID=A0A6S6QWY2_9HYPH|nr:triose-phosphate isomerase [Terrihabitans soli]BCJ91048.1 triosephosphate isomerase [Terrihabitans soli]